MRILITGGAGFIASHIADAYIKAGHKVVIVDNLATGFRKNVNPNAKFYRADIRNLTLMERIFKQSRPEVVSHHAAIAEVVKSIRNPIPTLESNVLGTANVLISFGHYGKGKRKFIFSSTGGAIYGKSKRIPANEKTPLNPLSPYALSKALGEDVIKFYARTFGFDYLIFRYSNVYGPRQNPHGEGGVVAIFGDLMKSGVRPTIFGDGTKTRDYIYVRDVVRANMLALRKGKNDTLNIGVGKEIRDQDVFDAIAEAAAFSRSPIYAPFREGEVMRSALDARRARRILGWTPKVTLKEGIRKTLATIR